MARANGLAGVAANATVRVMDQNDRDIVARTIVGEAAGQPFEGQQAVANVILNRLRSGRFGGSISDVVFAPYQFEPWQTRRGELMSISPGSPAYQQAGQAIDAALGGDVTGGATHFLQPHTVMQRSGKLPAWAQGTPVASIGAHVFFAPDGKASTLPGNSQQQSTLMPFNPGSAQGMGTPAMSTIPQSGVADALSSLAMTPQPGLTSQPAYAQIPGGNKQDGDTLPDPVFDPRTFRRTRLAAINRFA